MIFETEYNILFGKLKGKTTFGKRRSVWEGDVKTNLAEIRWRCGLCSL